MRGIPRLSTPQPTGVPQEAQNRAPGGSSALHDEQLSTGCTIGCPHAMQNFAPSGLITWHVPQASPGGAA